MSPFQIVYENAQKIHYSLPKTNALSFVIVFVAKKQTRRYPKRRSPMKLFHLRSSDVINQRTGQGKQKTNPVTLVQTLRTTQHLVFTHHA